MSRGRVAVTGGSGFVGGAIARAMRAAGFEVEIFSRRSVTGFAHRPYDLALPVADHALRGFSDVIHCAYDLTLRGERNIHAVNVVGTQRLISAAQKTGTRVVLVSSMSAYDGTQQIYGRAKLQSERDTIDAGGEAVRLGLVWGGSGNGMFGTLQRLARLPVIPDFGSTTYQYMVHVDDLVAALVRLLEAPRFGQAIGLANPARVPFKNLIRALHEGNPPIFVRVPWRLVYATVQTVETLGLPLPVRADSLLGLVKPAPEVPNVRYWDDVALSLRPFYVRP